MMNLPIRKQMLTKILFNKFQSLSLSRESTAQTLCISTATLDRLKDLGLGPKWTKDKRSKNGKVTYAIDHIVDYIIEQDIYKTA